MAHEIDIRKTTTAEVDDVWRLLGDSSSWPSWTPIESAEVTLPADPGGVGEKRTFTTGRVTVHEEIVERLPPHRLSYRLLAGLAVRDYRADIDLRSVPGGTEIRWHTTFEAKVPGTGWLYQREIRKATEKFVEGLATRAAAT